VCAFCARLGQTCRYNDDYFSQFGAPSSDSSLQQENSGLATRVALLESRLSVLDAGDNGAIFPSILGNSRSSQSTQAPGSEPQSNAQPSSSDLTSLLNAKILQSLADVYFVCSHQQPYSFFHEETFRQNLDNANLPAYLLLTFVATAVRFSEEPCFAGRQIECRDTYAKLAWSELMEDAFSDARNMDVRMVQAASMLGIIDYTGDHLSDKKSCTFADQTQMAETNWLGSNSDCPYDLRKR
jgi:hypothetical protein